MKRRIYDGFTLAEVLITLGIIGVVAALTLPTLVANYKKKIIISQLKSTYSTLNQAFKMAEAKNGPIDTWTGWNNSETIMDTYILPEIKGAQSYGISGDKGWRKPMCYDETVKLKHNQQCQYSWFDGRNYMSTPMGWYTSSFKLPNGACVGLNPNNYTPYHVFIDINGGKEPNAAGKDLFIFVINNNQLKPFGFELSDDAINTGSGLPGTYPCGGKLGKTVGYTCATRVIRDGWKINYY